MQYNIIRIIDQTNLIDRAAIWFSDKWGISRQQYLQSMSQCAKRNAVPQWYVVLMDNNIVGGCGVIENDFHDRIDLAPNLCALFVEPEVRGNKIAGALLSFVCRDMKNFGVQTLYLVTNHIGFYERYGWKYLCGVQCDGDDYLSRMYVRKICDN